MIFPTALSLGEYKAVCVVLGSVDGEEFLDFIVNNMVHCVFYFLDFCSIICQLPNMNPYPQDKSILIRVHQGLPPGIFQQPTPVPANSCPCAYGWGFFHGLLRVWVIEMVQHYSYESY
jgi:hypothetical protein